MTGNKKIFISGVTGFIGSGIAQQLFLEGFDVIACRRTASNLWRCESFKNQISWINLDQENWKELLLKFKPEIFIHAAWEGLNADDRDNWGLQQRNFEMSIKLFHAAIDAGVKTIISLGSQAEYGIFSQRIPEDYLPNPADAYGAFKLHTCNYLRLLCHKHQIQWVWLRVFSVFGPGENDKWLLPQVINKLLNSQAVPLTQGEQLYDYMYIKDFSKNLIKVVKTEKSDISGIYNFSSGKSIEIKKFLLNLITILNIKEELLKFGAIPYRSNQSMKMEGNCSKFENVFGKIEISDYVQSLSETVEYYKKIR